MQLSMTLEYDGSPRDSASLVRELEAAGLDAVWIREAYSFDAISWVGYLAAQTSRVQIGTAIVNIFSRTPALLAMSAAGCDHLSGGRFMLGLGASGPQVVEGFHGVPYAQPLPRTRETIEICRKVWRREPLTHDGKVFHLPLPDGVGRPLKLINRPDRPNIPVFWAALGDRSVAAAAEIADAWLPFLFIPDKAGDVFGSALREGLARRSSELGPLQVAATATVAIGDDLDAEAVLAEARAHVALYVGGMGSRAKNFYNDLACRYGYEAQAYRIQDLYLDGKKAEAAAAVPRQWLELGNLVGPAGYVKERLAAWREAGVTMLDVKPAGGDPVRTLATLRALVD